jgi:hypothetical protein
VHAAAAAPSCTLAHKARSQEGTFGGADGRGGGGEPEVYYGSSAGGTVDAPEVLVVGYHRNLALVL